MTVSKGAVLNFRCPYQAKVIKMFDISNRPMVRTGTGRFMMGLGGWLGWAWIGPSGGWGQGGWGATPPAADHLKWIFAVRCAFMAHHHARKGAP
ncbi:hypothetical protein GCM10007315_09570 [Gemmobacter tilapiae]|uniref:Uncharacterized protein n=1 Tax=Neogemmobacter tilapiae TaxID=875041 RepID=A0A918WJU9_9RHOB|nr:hypothetical protein GCM10007315_09570 [Gemmobacter tilapiae]